MASPLADLDELVLKCRDAKAKSYIKEAVSCYKSGAIRSAIIATWVGVSFDLIDKLRELNLAGDAEAKKQIDEFEKARKDRDFKKSLEFERNILTVARDKLELISTTEFIDLDRLREDRNRCAHPSMTAEGEVFSPSAELARVHIRSAVEHLLQHPPAQGKNALDLLISGVESAYFPTSVVKAVVHFEKSPLQQARKSLIRNFVIVLLKKIIDGVPFKEGISVRTALQAVEKIHRETYHATMSEMLSKLVKTLSDERLHNAFDLVGKPIDGWAFLDDDVKEKLETYVTNVPKRWNYILGTLLDHSALSNAAEKRINRMSREEIQDDFLIFFTLPQIVGDRIVELYSSSRSFAQANDFSPVVINNSMDFTKEQIKKIVEATVINSQVKSSSKVVAVLSALEQNENVEEKEIEDWIEEFERKKIGIIAT